MQVSLLAPSDSPTHIVSQLAWTTPKEVHGLEPSIEVICQWCEKLASVHSAESSRLSHILSEMAQIENMVHLRSLLNHFGNMEQCSRELTQQILHLLRSVYNR